MPWFRNEAKGVRSVRLADRTYVNIEPGETKLVRAGRFGAVPDGLVEVPEPDAHPLDHDGDGKPGGSTAPEDSAADLKSARELYETVMGKKPFNGWGVDELMKRMAS